MFKTLGKKGALLALMTVATLTGATGTMVFKSSLANAQSTNPTAAVSSPIPTATPPAASTNPNMNSTFKSNEDPAHEAKESAQWEAQENAGQMPWNNK